MLRNIFSKTIFENRRAVFWWALGFVALAAYMLALYPTIRENPAMRELAQAKLEVLQALIGQISDFAKPVGYLTGGLFSLVLPLMFLFFAAIMGANAIGGEEERKTLDLLLANPVSRNRIVLEKFGAMALLTIGFGAVVLLAFVIGGPSVGLFGGDLSVGNLLAGVISVVLLGLLFGTLALAVGAATGSRSLALGVAAGVALANYMVKMMAGQVGALASLQKALPMYYYLSDDINPLEQGLNVAHASVLLGGIVVLLGIAIYTFNRRDVAL